MRNKRGTLLILSGPSGAGKSTVIQAVMQRRENIYFSISCTTREPRPGEQHGVNYYYISNREFEQMIQEDAFLEYAGYVDHYYGTPRKAIEEHLSAGWDVILDIEVQGADIVRSKVPEAVSCFLIPPSFQELERRLHGRESESEEVIRGRLARAKEEYRQIPEYDYLVINDVAEQAAEEICAILQAAACRVSQRQEYIEGAI
ncbi:MAG: guanylate kinase [Oscillospiraceae bacterium]|nr:guanylate kinase [Oscillospiraceae bacterium]